MNQYKSFVKVRLMWCKTTKNKAYSITEDNVLPLESQNPAYRSNYNASQAVLNLGKDWIHKCLTSHPNFKANDESFKAPTRLLDVSKFRETHGARLVQSDALPDRIQYVTLSYCWGKTSDVHYPLRFVEANKSQFEEHIPAAAVPLTIAHEMEVAYGLVFSYLWVDSLCIIQDSDEDQTKQFGLMGKIYRHSTCTIAVTTARNSREGFLQRRDPLRFTLCRVSGTMTQGVFVRQSSAMGTPSKIREEQIDNAPLNERDWVVQERLLSPRTLHFGLHGIIFWECETREAYGGRPDGIVAEQASDHIRNALRMLLREPLPSHDHDLRWGPLSFQYQRQQKKPKKFYRPARELLWSTFNDAWNVKKVTRITS